uniref:Putative secreted protein n=1 Tax=Anopheles marajoara TaxID=58244 RepID=A0A2M4C6L9_9DIPT
MLIARFALRSQCLDLLHVVLVAHRAVPLSLRVSPNAVLMVGMFAEEKQSRHEQRLLAGIARCVLELYVAFLQMLDVQLDGNRLFTVRTCQLLLVTYRVLFLLKDLRKILLHRGKRWPILERQTVQHLERCLQALLRYNL